jgi:hypothetical protein
MRIRIPDPAFHFIVDPDPDSDPAPLQNDALQNDANLAATGRQTPQGSILSLHASIVSVNDS